MRAKKVNAKCSPLCVRQESYITIFYVLRAPRRVLLGGLGLPHGLLLALLGLVPQGERQELEAIAGGAFIDLKRRPETLSLEEFGMLSDAFSAAASERPEIGKIREE